MSFIAYQHSCDWRYGFNPKKCAIVIYDEDKEQNTVNSIRTFSLGPHRIKEKNGYEHVGVTSSIIDYDYCITADRLTKARRFLTLAQALALESAASLLLYAT